MVIANTLPYIDVTQKWLDAIDSNKLGQVFENDYFEADGARYDSSNSTIDMKFGNDELNISKRLSNNFHDDVHLVPRVAPNNNSNKYISAPDFVFKGEYFELKTVEGSGKESIINRIKRGVNQSNSFVVDIIEKISANQ